MKELVTKLQSEGRRQLAATLNKHQPVVLEDNIIEIAVDNPIQAGEIQENRQELLGYLKQKLMNGGIELRSRVTENGEGTFTAYTPAEKFSKMAEKNPDLNQLRQQFDLELDF
jgi:DNA polymerase-3 subunit gamma/tau